jgi:hypothetical protein
MSMKIKSVKPNDFDIGVTCGFKMNLFMRDIVNNTPFGEAALRDLIEY